MREFREERDEPEGMPRVNKPEFEPEFKPPSRAFELDRPARVNAPPPTFGVAEIAAGLAGFTFLRAYCEELGKRFGGSTADWLSKLRVRRHRMKSKAARLEVPVNGVTTYFEIADDGLPDEAKLALIDLDLTAEGIRGHRLRWDAEAQTWVPEKFPWEP